MPSRSGPRRQAALPPPLPVGPGISAGGISRAIHVVDRGVLSAKRNWLAPRPPPAPCCSTRTTSLPSKLRPPTGSPAGPQRRKRAISASLAGLVHHEQHALKTRDYREQELVGPSFPFFSRPAPNRDPARSPGHSWPPSPKPLTGEPGGGLMSLGRPPHPALESPARR